MFAVKRPHKVVGERIDNFMQRAIYGQPVYVDDLELRKAPVDELSQYLSGLQICQSGFER